jgi:ABC-2 type transport system permease protein
MLDRTMMTSLTQGWRNARRIVWPVARKDLAGFFNSPAALLFLAAFLSVTLFVFFWVDTFFSRNLADVRPLFQWMPVLLIFLVAALTMRSWAEERRAGTLELLLSAPASPTGQVLGKFAGAMLLVAIALALTLPLPLSVALLGPLDWGPVIGGYVAALALASAYVSIGLWVSSRTDNQIVSLILTVVIAGSFYLIGSSALTGLVGQRASELLNSLGAGSRFASITRGVLDLRDLYYYLSITATFLLLNRLAVERLRWAGNPSAPSHRRWYWVSGLLAANALTANLWLNPITALRADLTQGRVYTLSDATRGYLGELREPLVIRGYFSASTHPLLAPLVPRLRDLLQEYAVAGGSQVRVEFVDPREDARLEEEASSKYGIRPVPFQVASKYQAAVVNSYFNILVSYGDQYQVLGFRDLIDVKARSEGDVDVALRNPEYDITSAIRKILTTYQGGGNPFAALPKPLSFTGYITPTSSLPSGLVPARKALDDALAKLRAQAGNKLQVAFKDPGADAALAKQLGQDLGLRPLVAGLMNPQPFWFHLTLSDGRSTEQVPLPQDFAEDDFRQALEAAVKRFSPGFLKTVAVLTPAPAPQAPGMPPNHAGTEMPFGMLREVLGESARWLDTDLQDGQVPSSADMLLVLAPEDLTQRQLFAVDQFLMQGGTVVLSTAHTRVQIGQGIEGRPQNSGLEDWLAGHGLRINKGLVMDPKSGALPIPVDRPVAGGMTVREIQLLPYPYIIDVRDAGLDASNPVTASLGQMEVPWAAPIELEPQRNKDRKATVLLRSSPASWVSESPQLLPDFRSHPDLGFAIGSTHGAHTLAVMLEGQFESGFKGKDSPLMQAQAPAIGHGNTARTAPSAKAAAFGRVIDHSPASARLVVIGSNEVFTDQAMNIISQVRGSRELKAAQFMQNLVDWSLEDQGLLGIRSRGQFARTLAPITREAQMAWEYGNYALALGGLALVWALHRRRRTAAVRRYTQLLEGV